MSMAAERRAGDTPQGSRSSTESDTRKRVLPRRGATSLAPQPIVRLQRNPSSVGRATRTVCTPRTCSASVLNPTTTTT